MQAFNAYNDGDNDILYVLTNLPNLPSDSLPQVTFLLTEDPSYSTESRGRRRRRKRRRRESLSPDRFSLYSSLSSLSGGLTIFTTNSDIHKVSSIVEDNTASDKVQHFTTFYIVFWQLGGSQDKMSNKSACMTTASS